MSGKRVLVVDDEEDILVPTTNFLKKKLKNTEVLSAFDGEEALKIVSERPADVVVTDIRMPKLDGLEFMVRAKQKNPSTRFIVMTAYGSPSVREKATRLGAVHYIEKPFELDDLYEKVKQLLEFGDGFQGSVAQLELTDIVQVVCLGKKSVTIEVKSGVNTGYIYVLDGDIINAKTGNLEGEEAFYEIVSWSSGEFRFLPPEEDVEKRIDMRWENLLMEAMRIIDERRREREKSEEAEFEIDFNTFFARLKERVDGVVSSGIIDLSSGKLIAEDEVSVEDKLDEKVERYAEFLLFTKNLIDELEKSDLREIFLVLEKVAIAFYKIGERFVWGIKIEDKDNLGKLKIVVEKILREAGKE